MLNIPQQLQRKINQNEKKIGDRAHTTSAWFIGLLNVVFIRTWWLMIVLMDDIRLHGEGRPIQIASIKLKLQLISVVLQSRELTIKAVLAALDFSNATVAVSLSLWIEEIL